MRGEWVAMNLVCNCRVYMRRKGKYKVIKEKGEGDEGEGEEGGCLTDFTEAVSQTF